LIFTILFNVSIGRFDLGLDAVKFFFLFLDAILELHPFILEGREPILEIIKFIESASI